MKNEKKINTSPIILLIKFIAVLFIFFQIKYGVNEKNISIINNKRNLLSLLNITEYNMIRFVDYETLEFNSLQLFNYFRKKYFNISYVELDYDEINKTSKLEYIIGFYNETQQLMKPTNESKGIKYSCLAKKRKNLILTSPIIIEDKYYKCIDFINISDSTDSNKIGINMKKNNARFTLYINFDVLIDYFKYNKSKITS